ncbi:MAG: PAS domain S-box protein, partial [Gemmatimonadales bacterium]
MPSTDPDVSSSPPDGRETRSQRRVLPPAPETPVRPDKARGLSIRFKLSLVIAALVAAVTVAYSWAAYHEMHTSARTVTETRLRQMAVQWAQLLSTSRSQQAATARRLAGHGAIRALVTRPDDRTRQVAESLLRAEFRPGGQRPAALIAAADLRELARAGDTGSWTDPSKHVLILQKARLSDSGVVSPLFTVGDSVVYGSVTRILEGGEVRGYLVEWRRFAASTEARDQLNRLFGDSTTTVRIANRTGELWTDLVSRIPSPGVDLLTREGLLDYAREGADARFAVARPIPGTPWAIVLETSRAEVLAQPRRFLGRLALLGSVALLAGAIGAVSLGVRLTRPLERLTGAVEAVAMGDYTRPTGLARSTDELGRLATAFDVMVDHIQDALAARKASEERHRRLFESVPLPCWVYDRRGLRILEVNEAAIRHYGYSREEFLTMTLADLRPPDELPKLEASLRDRDDRTVYTGEWRHVTRDGRLLDVEVSSHAIDFDGRPARIVVIHDITDQKQLVGQMQASEEKYRRLIRDAPVGVSLTTMGGRFLAVNPALVEMLGFDSEEEMLAVDARRVYARREDRQAMIARLEEQGRVNRQEIELRRRDGTLITARMTARVVPGTADGEPCLETVTEDVTAQKKTERQLQQAQKMDAVGQLAGGIAHDFNNMLTVILSHAELLLDGLPPADQRSDDVEAIRSAANSAAALTRQLLVFSRQQMLQPRVLAPGELIDNTGKMLKRLIGEDIVLETSLSPDTGSVMMDPGQLEQVVVNLAVNARDAMPDGGRLLIETANVEITEPIADGALLIPAGRYIMLSVTDTGVGMDR